MADTRATTPKEWAIAVIGGLAFAAMLILWLRPAGQTSATRPPPTSTTAQIVQPGLAAPSAPAGALPPQTAPALVLRGLLPRATGGSAILETQDGAQRLVAVGRIAAPGWRLAALDATSATLESASGARHHLTFDRSSPAPTARAASPETPSTPITARAADLAATSTAYRLALKPIQGKTEITGWTVQTPETVPLLRLAGLRPGDVLQSVNGQPLFSEEKVIELPQEIAGARIVELGFERDGQKATVRIDLTR